MIHLSHNPDKLEAKALDYERKGKAAKAIKYREKAARLRNKNGLGVATNPIPVVHPAGVVPVGGVAPVLRTTPRTPAVYEANALKWEQRGNWTKAQKNREKVWRMRNPNYSTATAPQFYRENRFLGYDLTPVATVTGTDYNHDGIPDQLQGGARVGAGARVGGVPTATVTGTDYNRDGIPDQLQGGARLPTVATHGLSPTGVAYPPHSGGGLPFSHKKRDPVLLESKAADYERRGKPAKARKLREKAAKVRAGTYTSARTPEMWEANALKWEKRGNWDKAQKNRAKYWKHQNPQYASYQAPAFYRDNRFLGYSVPYQPQPQLIGGMGGIQQQPHLIGGMGGVQHIGGPGQLYSASALNLMRPSRDVQKLELKAAQAEAKGKREKAMRLRNKATQIRAGSYTSHRTPEIYERNALKWEQRGNWQKAQNNRAKAWRLRNPQYALHTGPSFYQNGSFQGYNVPFTPSQSTLLPYYSQLDWNQYSGLPASHFSSYTTTTTSTLPGTTYTTGGYTTLPGTTTTYSTGGLPTQQFVGQTHGGVGGLLLSSRDPYKLEQRALEAERKGKHQKATKLREKANRIRGNAYTPRTTVMLEQKAIFYEQQGNFKKAQKLREKVWRQQSHQNLSYATAPSFYNNNVFVGYQNVVLSGLTQSMANTHISTQTTYRDAIVEQVVRPVIVEETLRAERIVEVQPIIHREIDAPQVRIVEQHVYETVPASGPSTITNAAIVQETVRPKIIEEVQQIVHREVPAPFVERVEQHVTEHIVNPTITTKEVQQDTTIRTSVAGVVTAGAQIHHSGVGVVGGVPTATITGTDFNRDGIPDQLQGGVGRVGVVGATQIHHSGVGIGGVVGGVPTATISGTDYNRDGIPDQLQGGARVGGIGGVAGGVGIGGVPTATISGTDYNRDGIPDQLQGGARIHHH